MRYYYLEGFTHLILEDGRERTPREIGDEIEFRAKIEVNKIALCGVLNRLADEGHIERIEIRPMKADGQLWFRKLQQDCLNDWANEQTKRITEEIQTLDDVKRFQRAVRDQLKY